MSGLLLTLLLLLRLTYSVLSQHDQDDFINTCPPTTCGSGSLQIRFPLRLRPAPAACGLAGLSDLNLTCSGNDTLLTLPTLPPFKVTGVDYERSRLAIHVGSGFGSLSSPCPLHNLSSFDFLNTARGLHAYTASVSLLSCEANLGSDPSASFAGPILCLSGSGRFMYVADEDDPVEDIPHGCVGAGSNGELPYPMHADEETLGEIVRYFVEKRDVTMDWSDVIGAESCQECEEHGKFCGLSCKTNRTFCYSHKHYHGPSVVLITGASIGGFVVLLSASIIIFYIARQFKKEKETFLKVKRFLATYNGKPTRYTFSGIKKITKRFRHNLGHGGFGSVYKGELPGGIPVAVKMLEKSKGDGGEFINEVAAIGRIHHANVVRLFGFCSEGSRRALIYEFMPNESLEKFILSKEEQRNHPPFSMEKLLEIALGVAHGIEYLHQGHDQHILHFDIKPHNILLDHNFNPKISDFGHVKLCSRDHSIVTMTAARGTMGYIAPEIYNRNFGTVSYKSDVYSFGMLLLEMVSGRINVDPTVEDQTEVYFPEWIYGQLIREEDFGLATEKNRKEEDIVKKLVIVALWCIQMSPNDRPTMTRVIQLLMGNLDSLQIPPKPFVSSDIDNVSRDSHLSSLLSSSLLKLEHPCLCPGSAH